MTAKFTAQKTRSATFLTCPLLTVYMGCFGVATERRRELSTSKSTVYAMVRQQCFATAATRSAAPGS
jgi:hypothetical protein